MPKKKTVKSKKYIEVGMFDQITYTGIPKGYGDSFVDGMAYMLDLIDEAPGESGTNLGRSEWRVKDDQFMCKSCHKNPLADPITGKIVLSKFCPHCGKRT